MRWTVSVVAALLAIGSPLPGTPNIIWGWDYVNSKPVKVRAAADGTLAGGGGGGGTSSTFGAAFPATGTAAGAKVVSSPPSLVAGNMEAPTLTTAGRLIVDASQVTSPISATALPLPTNASQEHTTAASPNSCRLSDGAAFYNAPTSAQLPTALDGSGFLKTHEQGTVPVSKSGTWAMDQGTAAALSGAWPVKVTDGTNVLPTMDTAARAGFTKLTDGTNTTAVKAASTAAAATDPSAVVQLSPNQPQLTTPLNVNQTQMNGVAVSAGQGVADTGTQRVFVAQKASYAAVNTRTATAAGTGVFFNICGSASKTIRLQYLQFDIQVATTTINSEAVLTKTSAATTAGTATTLTNIPNDSNSAAGTAVVKYFTALGTAGTAVGKVDVGSGLFPVTASPRITATAPVVFDYRTRAESETFVLRGTAQCIEAAFAVTTTNAPTMSVAAKWTEE